MKNIKRIYKKYNKTIQWIALIVFNITIATLFPYIAACKALSIFDIFAVTLIVSK